MIKKLVFFSIGLLIVSLIGVGIAFAYTGGYEKQSNTISQEDTLRIDSIHSLVIETISENVSIYKTDSNELSYKYFGSYSCISCTKDYKITSHVDQDQVKIQTDNGKYNFGIFLYSDIKLNIYLPASYHDDMTISTISGDVSIEPDYQFDQLSIDTISGDIHLDTLAYTKGNFSSISGDLHGETITGDINWDTTSGNFRIDHYEGSIVGSSISGNFNIQEEAADFNFKFSTTSGNVTLNLLDTADYIIHSTTVSGDVHDSLNHNTGTNGIYFDSISGDLSIK